MTWIFENADNLLAIAEAAVILGLAVAAVTPTDADDTFFGRLKNLLAKVKK